MINALKDAVTSRAALAFASRHLAPYGTVEHLKIDSQHKTIDLSCHLHGEPTPIQLKVESYVVETEGGKKFFHAKSFTCSRPWLQCLLTDFAVNRRVELPPWAAAAL